LPAALLAKAREKGLHESLRLTRDIARTRMAGRSRREEQTFVFLSPPMGNSGAPHVLMQVVDEFARTYGPGSVRLLSPVVAAPMRDRAAAGGVSVERAVAVMGPALVGLQLALRRDDFVFMNTVGVPRNYVSFVLDSLRTQRLAHAYWYIHEDIDQLPIVAPFLLESNFQSLIARLVEQDRLTLMVPSHKVKTQYDNAFDTVKTKLLPFKSDVGEDHVRPRPAGDYTSMRFLLSGRPTDGRKGHMMALAAFHEFMKAYYEENPEGYRDFTLTLVGMSEDYVAEQIRSIGLSVLGDRLKIVSEVSRDEALKIARRCNAVICCSFNEALPLYVIEGMSMGHVVLRNDAGGMEEQLDEGVNGFRIDSRDVKQFAGVLESVLNKQAMSESRLQAMGTASQTMIADLRIQSYVEALELAR
jgi:glycosyltransferase involved in cell wall biosynthesis